VPLSRIIFGITRLRQCCIVLSLAIITALLSGCSSLSKEQARSILLTSDPDLQKTIYVDLGYLNGHCGQSPTQSKYAVLQKAGLISIGNTGTSTEVLTTTRGDDLFRQIGAKRMDTANFKAMTGMSNCNLHNWAIPIASKEMKDVTVTPAGDNGADVIYNWTWKPNEVGENFAIDSDTFKSLNRHAQESLSDGDLPLDNSYPHATKVHFYHDGNGWHLGKNQ